MRFARIAMLMLLGLGTSLGAQRRPDQPVPSILERVRINSERPIDFHAATWPDTVYVGQQINYQVGVFLSEGARSRLRRNPEFLPPELRGLIAYELGAPRRVGTRSVNGITFEAHVFQRALFPVASGDVVVPAPQLSYSLPSSASYFSREESFVVRAESTSVYVRALPAVNRPDDFTGAVGRFAADARFDRDSLRVGDPVVLTLRVSGIGNVKLLPRPSLEVPWASTVASTERLRIDSSGTLVRGFKEFDWILTPARAGTTTLAPIRYSYFDPYREEYALALSDSVVVVIGHGSIVANPAGEGFDLLPLRENPGTSGAAAWLASLSRDVPRVVTVGLLVLAPMPALLLLATGTRHRRTQPQEATLNKAREDLARLAQVSGSAAVHAHDEARNVRRVLQEALAQRLGVRTQQLTDRRQVGRLLRRRGATRETVSDTLQLLDKLDRAGFAADAASIQDRYAASARDLVMRVEEETLDPSLPARGRWRNMPVVAVLSASLIAPPSDVLAPQDSALRANFDAARHAYEQRQFADAAARFDELAQQFPSDLGVLVNWGTAAWATGDTVSAVIAWQRAVRLDPFADDLQERIALLPGGAYGGVAHAPAVDPSLSMLLGMIAWTVGWLAFAIMFFNRRHMPRVVRLQSAAVPLAAFLVLSGGAGVAYSLLVQRNTDIEQLYVVARPETMRTGSGLDADAVGGVATGDVVRRIASESAWMQVEHADGRRGWLPNVRLTPIAPLAGMK